MAAAFHFSIMPDFTCSISDITSDALCTDRGGLVTVFAADDSTIDWDEMADSGNYDPDTNTVLNWQMTPGSSWSKFIFERKSGRLDGTYTADSGFYDAQLLNLLFKGKNAARTVTLGQLVGCCGLILQIHDASGRARVIGKEYISGIWINALERGRVLRHLDTTGAYGSQDDRNRDEMDFGAQHAFPFPYSSLSIAQMEAVGETANRIFGFAVNKVFGISTTKIFGF